MKSILFVNLITFALVLYCVSAAEETQNIKTGFAVQQRYILIMHN